MYEEVIHGLGDRSEITAMARNFSIDCPVHGKRIVQRQAGHISVKPLPAHRFTKLERKIIEERLVGDELTVFKRHPYRYPANADEIARWKALLRSP